MQRVLRSLPEQAVALNADKRVYPRLPSGISSRERTLVRDIDGANLENPLVA